MSDVFNSVIVAPNNVLADGTDEVLHRMQELIDEANRATERCSILEEY